MILDMLAEHQRRERGMTEHSPDYCSCGEAVHLNDEQWTKLLPIDSRRDLAFAEHQARHLEKSLLALQLQVLDITGVSLANNDFTQAAAFVGMLHDKYQKAYDKSGSVFSR